MKRKISSFGKAFLSKKRFALVEIAIVLCSVFLVAIPAVAAQEQNQAMQKASATVVTTASEDDFILDIYGNANEDDTIDMGDVVYTKLAIFGKKPKTELCDAKYDGRINVLDVIQTKLIILGKEKELTVVDSADRIVTVNKPIKRIAVLYSAIVETLRSLHAKDKIVGVNSYTISEAKTSIFFQEFADYPNIGNIGYGVNLNYEELLNCHPDAVFLIAPSGGGLEEIVNKLKELDPNIAAVCVHSHRPESCVEDTRKLGYILDRREDAEEFINFYEEVMNAIKDKVGGISKEERPKVYYEAMRPYHTCGIGHSWGRSIDVAGGNNIFSDLSGCVQIDPEEVIKRNPEIIVRMTSVKGYDTDDITELSDVRDEILGCPELANVAAVKNGRVYIIITGIHYGARHFIGIAYQAKWFHPELFEDLDPKEMHQEYLTRFQGLDIDLDKKGVFVYPAPS